MKYKIVILLIVIFSFVSCGILLTKKKDFSIYKEPIRINAVNLKTNGLFWSKTNYQKYHLYENGMVKYASGGYALEKNNTIFIDTIKFYNYGYNNAREIWGHYYIKNDTLIMQYFNYNFYFLYNRFILEEQAIIINDTSFVLYDFKSYYKKRNKRFRLDPDTFCLYKTQLKPDSTKAWFVNKDWYLENLHESRK